MVGAGRAEHGGRKAAERSAASRGGLESCNPADLFLVHDDKLPELTSDQRTALAKIAKTGRRLTNSALSRETRSVTYDHPSQATGSVTPGP